MKQSNKYTCKNYTKKLPHNLFLLQLGAAAVYAFSRNHPSMITGPWFKIHGLDVKKSFTQAEPDAILLLSSRWTDSKLAADCKS